MLLDEPTFTKVKKTTGVKPDPNASEIYLREIDAFRRRQRFSAFVKIRPFITYLMSKPKKDDFYEFATGLENLRCSLGMNIHRFYKIAAEFVREPKGQHYYQPQFLFCSLSYEESEFKNRTVNVLGYLGTVVEERDNEEEILNWARKIESISKILDMKCGFNTKDWFCLAGVVKYISNKNWSDEQAVSKIGTFYRNRARKVYSEMLFMDVVVHRELDHLNKNNTKKKTTVEEAISKEPYYSDWEQQVIDAEKRRQEDDDIIE